MAGTTSLAENSGTGTVLYTAAEAVDPEGDTLTYSVVGADGGYFTINANRQVSFAASPNYEAKNTATYSFKVRVTDAGGLYAETSETVTVTVVNVNDAPTIGAGTVASASVRTVAENNTSFASTIFYTAAVAADEDSGDTLTYSVAGRDGSFFTINANRQVSFAASPDYEATGITNGEYKFKVRVTDNGTGNLWVESEEVTVTVTNVNEAPTIGAGTVASASVRTVAENSGTSAVFYTAAVAADEDSGDTLTYSVVDEDGGTDGDSTYFTINQSTRAVTFAASPNFEAKDSGTYKFKVRVSDGSLSATASDTVTVTVTNVSEKAKFTVSANASGALVALNTLDDEVGVDSSGFTYTWQKTSDTLSGGETVADLTGWAAISGQTSASYTPASDDGYVRLQQITYTDTANTDKTVTLGNDFIYRISHPSGSFLQPNTLNDYIFGASSGQTLFSTGGNDIIFGEGGADTIFGGAGNDIVFGGAGNDIIAGDNENTQNGNDMLYGGTGNDNMLGGNNNDFLDGGAGIDLLEGNAGNDIFVLELASGSRGKDVVIDFATGDNKIQIAAPDGTASTIAALQAADYAQLGSGETLHWVTNTTSNTRTSNQGNAATADTVFFIDADGDNTLDSTETVVLILEDYNTALTANDFDIV